MELREFLSAFFRSSENICIRAFSDKKAGSYSRKFDVRLNRVDRFLNVLRNVNRDGNGIFFVVNYGGHNDKEIKRVNAQFFESDSLSIEEQMEQLEGFPLEPSIIVQTRKSLHVYFLIKDGEIERFREIQKVLVKRFKGDSACVNESRVMRLPGFYHCKKEPIEVKCIKFNPHLVYTQEEIHRHLSISLQGDKGGANTAVELFYTEEGSEKWRENRAVTAYDGVTPTGKLTVSKGVNQVGYMQSSNGFSAVERTYKGYEEGVHKSDETAMSNSSEGVTTQGGRGTDFTGVKHGKSNRRGLRIVDYKCLFIKYCRENSSTLREPLWHAMITNLAVFSGGREKIHEYSMDYEGYTKEETDRKIEIFLSNTTYPMTCTTIYERGFSCPMLGKCGCKSPASFSFRALNFDELGEVLGREVVFNDYSKNTFAAMKFIDDYLYNVQPAIGDIVISELMKSHFLIKSIKSLRDYYKNINKEYEKSLKGKGEVVKLPPWYKEGENGMRFLPGILAEHLIENINGFNMAERFYIYEHGVYREISDDMAANMVRNYLLKEYCNMYSIKDARDQWRISILKGIKEVNSEPYVLNLRNGLLDIRSKILEEHRVDFYSTIQLKVKYNPDAKCPRFLKFLEEVLQEELIPLVQEIMGYLLVPITSAQKAFLLVGPPRTGKSTILWIIEELILGKGNVSNIPWQDLSERFKTAELMGKLANVFADLPNKAIEDAGVFKVITGEDYLMGERKNKDPFKFKPFARLLFSCNEIPRNYADKTQAFYRRLIILPFSKQVSMECVDVNLRDKLTEEVEGIFLWAIEGLYRLMDRGFVFSENSITDKAKEAYRSENNSVITFVDEICTIGDGLTVRSKELYGLYREFCNENGIKAYSVVKFNGEIESNFTSVNKDLESVSRCRIWKGIGV